MYLAALYLLTALLTNVCTNTYTSLQLAVQRAEVTDEVSCQTTHLGTGEQPWLGLGLG